MLSSRGAPKGNFEQALALVAAASNPTATQDALRKLEAKKAAADASKSEALAAKAEVERAKSELQKHDDEVRAAKADLDKLSAAHATKVQEHNEALARLSEREAKLQAHALSLTDREKAIEDAHGKLSTERASLRSQMADAAAAQEAARIARQEADYLKQQHQAKLEELRKIVQ